MATRIINRTTTFDGGTQYDVEVDGVVVGTVGRIVEQTWSLSRSNRTAILRTWIAVCRLDGKAWSDSGYDTRKRAVEALVERSR